MHVHVVRSHSLVVLGSLKHRVAVGINNARDRDIVAEIRMGIELAVMIIISNLNNAVQHGNRDI